MNKRQLLGKVFDFLAVGFILVLAINLVVIFFLAFVNGGEILVTINRFGEKGVEAVLFPIGIIMGFVVLIRMWRKGMPSRG